MISSEPSPTLQALAPSARIFLLALKLLFAAGVVALGWNCVKSLRTGYAQWGPKEAGAFARREENPVGFWGVWAFNVLTVIAGVWLVLR